MYEHSLRETERKGREVLGERDRYVYDIYVLRALHNKLYVRH